MRVLYCEDDGVLSKLTKLQLEFFFDCEVIHFDNGKDALRHLQVNRDYDLVFSDNQMPYKKGLDIFQFLVENEINIPFLLYSGENLDPPEGLTFLLKPYEPEELIKAINEALDIRHSTVANGEENKQDYRL